MQRRMYGRIARAVAVPLRRRLRFLSFYSPPSLLLSLSLCILHADDANRLELRLVPGDELQLKHPGDASHPAWGCVGHVVRLTANEEVAVEMRSNHNVPTDLTHGYSVDFVWKSTSFDRFVLSLSCILRLQNCFWGVCALPI